MTRNFTKVSEFMIYGNVYNTVKVLVDNYNSEYEYHVWKNNRLFTFDDGTYYFSTKQDADESIFSLMGLNDDRKRIY